MSTQEAATPSGFMTVANTFHITCNSVTVTSNKSHFQSCHKTHGHDLPFICTIILLGIFPILVRLYKRYIRLCEITVLGHLVESWPIVANFSCYPLRAKGSRRLCGPSILHQNESGRGAFSASALFWIMSSKLPHLWHFLSLIPPKKSSIAHFLGTVFIQ